MAERWMLVASIKEHPLRRRMTAHKEHDAPAVRRLPRRADGAAPSHTASAGLPAGLSFTPRRVADSALHGRRLDHACWQSTGRVHRRRRHHHRSTRRTPTASWQAGGTAGRAGEQRGRMRSIAFTACAPRRATELPDRPPERPPGAMLEPPATRDDTASIVVPSLVAGMCGEGVGTDAQSRTNDYEK